MITSFPLFTKLTAAHKSDIKSMTSGFKPYSDFNFTSLFCWDINGSVEISNLNDNLVIKLPDYVTGQEVYSILGEHDIEASLLALTEITQNINLVPEAVIELLPDTSIFTIAEDRDSFDYIYSLSSLASLPDSKFKSKRKRISKFHRTHSDTLVIEHVDLQSETARQDIRKIFDLWKQERMKDDIEVMYEKIAINRLLTNAPLFKMDVIKISINDKPVGFSINEVINNKYAVCHFQKTLPSYEYIDIYLSNYVAKDLEGYGCTHVNWEQDLGLPGLRELKMSYLPEYFLKKYTVARATH